MMDTNKKILLDMAKISDDAYDIGPKNSENYKIIRSPDRTKLCVWKKIMYLQHLIFIRMAKNYERVI